MKLDDPRLDWIRLYAEGTAPPDTIAELEAALSKDAALREYFVEYLNIDLALATNAILSEPCSVIPMTNRWDAHWRTAALSAAACLVVALSLIWIQGRSEPWAKIVQSGPGVEILRAGKATPATAGATLDLDEAVRVGDNGLAKLSITGLGIAVLGPEGHLQRAHEERVLQLKSGFIGIEARKQPTDKPWRIRTLEAEVAVIGTKFGLASAAGRTALRVTEGRVQLRSLETGETHEIDGGGRAFVSGNRPTVVEASRSGSVLLLTSRRPPSARWNRFNRLLGDKLVGSRLWRLGFRVETRHYDEVQAGDLADRALVIVSLFDQGVGEAALERIGLASARVPVLCLEPAAYPTLKMASGAEGVAFGFKTGPSPAEIAQAENPICSDVELTPSKWYEQIVGWGRPGPAAEIIAHLAGHPDQAVAFTYDTAQLLQTAANETPTLAPARRVGLFLDPTVMADASSTDLAGH